MKTVTIRGCIRLPSPQRFESAVAIVGLDDVSRIDALSVRIAETVIDPVRGVWEHIPFCLTAEERLLTSDSYVLSAEIRHARTALARGDFLTTAAFPWAVGDRDDKVIDVTPV